MKVPELYELEFRWMIENAIKETEKQIEQIIAYHSKGTYEEKQAREYINFLENILNR